MAKAVEEWTDARLNDLAAALEPVPSQLAVVAASVERLTEENRALRAEVAAMQLQLIQISWGLVAALVGAAAAIAGAVL
jgi:hypothetical protein